MVEMVTKLTRANVALEQLDWAIRLFLDHHALVPAITLAGAVDELLGKGLGDASAIKEAGRRLEGFGMEEKLNDVRNWLKHGTGGEELDVFDLEGHAHFMFMRIGHNLSKLGIPLSYEGRRFNDWLETNREVVLNGVPDPKAVSPP